MTALTKGIAREGKNSKMPHYGVDADAIIFRGALTMINAAGFLVPCSDIAGAVFAGIARTEVDATGLFAGECGADVESVDAYEVAIVGAVAADMGKKVYALDDNTVGLVQAGNEVDAGRIIEVISATKVMVKPNSHVTK